MTSQNRYMNFIALGGLVLGALGFAAGGAALLLGIQARQRVDRVEALTQANAKKPAEPAQLATDQVSGELQQLRAMSKEAFSQVSVRLMELDERYTKLEERLGDERRE
jgi:hypothetical protein